MSASRVERRAGPRQRGADCRWLTGARLRTGLEVAVIDLAHGGALVEAASRLLPGSVVELHLAAPGWRWSAPARVLRCHVSAVVANEGLRYRAALGFDRGLTPPLLDETRMLVSLPSGAGAPREPADGDSAGSRYPFTPTAVTLREVATPDALRCHRPPTGRRQKGR